MPDHVICQHLPPFNTHGYKLRWGLTGCTGCWLTVYRQVNQQRYLPWSDQGLVSLRQCTTLHFSEYVDGKANTEFYIAPKIHSKIQTSTSTAKNFIFMGKNVAFLQTVSRPRWLLSLARTCMSFLRWIWKVNECSSGLKHWRVQDPSVVIVCLDISHSAFRRRWEQC